MDYGLRIEFVIQNADLASICMYSRERELSIGVTLDV